MASERQPTTQVKVTKTPNLLERILPNCRRALQLAQLGTERPLKWLESLSLRYHGQLCPGCQCKARRFAAVRQRCQTSKRPSPNKP